jgi:hypothetical protein
MKVSVDGEDAFVLSDTFDDLVRKFLVELEVISNGT